MDCSKQVAKQCLEFPLYCCFSSDLTGFISKSPKKILTSSPKCSIMEIKDALGIAEFKEEVINR
jgi:hypothetical protein